MARRRHLGSVYTMYPAKSLSIWFGTRLYKLIAAFVCCAVFAGIYYVFIGVVNFNKNNFLHDSPKTTAMEMFKSELSLWIFFLACAAIVFWIFRTRIGERRKAENNIR
ncbi:hypothetical protein P0136_07360 [Lentisphaerota bacterium ZTH]|nr:hypothetical protein JYG24_01525 [Lentisphaerota bacterium]WET05186.1 hypothetical protein P0136_07360 [Lentisphaerota bacterium ZTH]